MRFCKTRVPAQPLMLLLALSLLSCRHEASHSVPQPVIPTVHQEPTPIPLDRIAAGFQPTYLKDERAHIAFVAMDDPKMVPAAAASFLNPEEYVLGFTQGDESRAYPVRFLKFHHIINDSVGTPPKPVAITYCDVCNSGIRYDPVVNGRRLMFDFYGVYNGVATLTERQTKSIFLLEEGRIVSGPLSGTQLRPESLLDTTWNVWKRLHPHTLVMSDQTPYAPHYGSAYQLAPRGASALPSLSFQESITHTDARLPPFSLVLAVTLPTDSAPKRDPHRAYPLQTLEHAGGVINDRWGKEAVAVLMDTRSQTATALSRRQGDRTLTLEARKQPDGTLAFYDHETGTRWDLEGHAETGPLAGKSLTRLDNHLCAWYGWAASFPSTSLYGHSAVSRTTHPLL